MTLIVCELIVKNKIKMGNNCCVNDRTTSN